MYLEFAQETIYLKNENPKYYSFIPTDDLLFKMEKVSSKNILSVVYARKSCYTYFMNAFVLDIFGFSTEKIGLFSKETFLSRCNFGISTEKRYHVKSSGQYCCAACQVIYLEM